jgi:hypothetical protein
MVFVSGTATVAIGFVLKQRSYCALRGTTWHVTHITWNCRLAGVLMRRNGDVRRGGFSGISAGVWHCKRLLLKAIGDARHTKKWKKWVRALGGCDSYHCGFFPKSVMSKVRTQQ